MPNLTDASVTRLRAIVAVIDREMVEVPPSTALQSAWTELVKVLALGPAPQTRVCPTCQGVGMRAATRCGNCWTALEVLPAQVEGVVQ